MDNLSAIDYAMTKGKEEGLAEGLEKGKEEGLAEGKLETAKKMLEKGLDISLIAQCTGLSEEVISKFKK